MYFYTFQENSGKNNDGFKKWSVSESLYPKLREHSVKFSKYESSFECSNF